MRSSSTESPAPASPPGPLPASAPAPAPARAWRFARHARRLLADLLAYAVVNRAVGLAALILGLLLLGLVMLAGQAAVPLLYPFF